MTRRITHAFTVEIDDGKYGASTDPDQWALGSLIAARINDLYADYHPVVSVYGMSTQAPIHEQE